MITNKNRVTKVYTFDVAFVLQVVAENEAEANKVCAEQGGYIVSREQNLKSVSEAINPA